MYIQRSKIDQLTKDMIRWRDKAHYNYNRANAVCEGYLEKAAETGGSRVDAEVRAAKDARYVKAVGNNQMYDRFATRDAAVLTALASMVSAGLLEVRDELAPEIRESLSKIGP